jgi:hypothetical protein
MDHQLRDVTVEQFRSTLLDAVDHIDVIQPEALREPVSLWLRAVEEEARQWRHLLGRSVVSPWNAAISILAASEVAMRDTMTASMRCGKCHGLASGEYGADELKCPCGATVISFKPRPHPLEIPAQD